MLIYSYWVPSLLTLLLPPTSDPSSQTESAQSTVSAVRSRLASAEKSTYHQSQYCTFCNKFQYQF